LKNSVSNGTGSLEFAAQMTYSLDNLDNIVVSIVGTYGLGLLFSSAVNATLPMK